MTSIPIETDDPTVQWSAPHVAQSLEQEAYLWQSRLDYLVDAPPIKLEAMLFGEFADELEIATGLEFIQKRRSQFFVNRIILFRILLYLVRN